MQCQVDVFVGDDPGKELGNSVDCEFWGAGICLAGPESIGPRS